jgi:dTDP-3-amino-2,3,6-trideoxy-4-keto-D-glucose/dTDP-3-amino-3,4,6-trideoxy-alpha-D-glucose/dTDP-2,6-dideoxy-D-kanosamine transaminase
VSEPWKVRYSYLLQQFAGPEEILDGIRGLLRRGDFTLGAAVRQFEESFAYIIGTRHAVGVGSGTDALKLGLKAAGVGPGDEVITAANTFIATVGAIHEIGARAVLVDVTPYYTVDTTKIEKAITRKTRAIMPVHLTGEPADMDEVLRIARKRKLVVVEDACQAIGARYKGKNTGTMGVAAGFSLHPLKNLNVWGDGGIVVTNSDKIEKSLRLLRNHGLANRDEIALLGHNSRLDTLQAIVGNWLIKDVDEITEKRIHHAALYETAFAELDDVLTLPPLRPDVRRVYHLFMVRAKRRDELLKFLLENGIEAKVHYPIPLHLQKGLKPLGYRRGDFPESERQAREVISFPVDQHLTADQIQYAIDTVKRFYRG